MSDAPRPWVSAGASLVVLTRDAALVETLKVLGSEHSIDIVGVEADLAGKLLGGHTGVALVDAAAAATPVEQLTERLKSQFPDLVLIVAGRVEHQNSLAAKITNGTVYRFLHMPASDQRVKLFVDAAWRRHGEVSAGGGESRSSAGMEPAEQTTLPRNAVIGGGIVLAALVIAGGWFMTRNPEAATTATADATTQTPVGAGASDEVLEDLLRRADTALAAGALLSPQGNNAAELYRQALRRNDTDSRAAAGIEKVIGRLVAAAEAQLAAQHLDEAQKLTDQARAIKADHVRVAFLTAQIAKERERAVLTQARQAASSGNLEQAIAVLDGASRDGHKSTLVTEARDELEHKKLDGRVTDYLDKATDRMSHGNLVEPPQDNAHFYVESARAIAPNDPDVRQTAKKLADSVLAEARKALASGDAALSQHWIEAAAESGVSHEDLDDLARESQRVQTSVQTDAMARIALLFNQRLTQGRLVDPPSDNAKFYLAQLVQSDASSASTILARQTMATRTLDEAKSAARRQDFTGARRWLTEAREAGAEDAAVSAVEQEMSVAQDAEKRANEFVAAGTLVQTHSVAAVFPVVARQKGISGWVDIQFVVKTDGSVSDVVVTGAEPVGMFEQAGADAVRKWRYQPVERDGHLVEQHTRLRMKFALEN